MPHDFRGAFLFYGKTLIEIILSLKIVSKKSYHKS